jgi:AcrR family transcriptional regulator
MAMTLLGQTANSKTGWTYSGQVSKGNAWSSSVADHKRMTRTHILEVAEELVAERGAAGMAMTTLARRAAVARATLYNYFPDLEQVLEALVEAQVERFVDDLDRRIADVPDPGGRLRIALATLVTWTGEKAPAGRTRTASAARRRPPGPALVSRIHRPLAKLAERLTPLVADAGDAGLLASGIEPALAVRFVLALVFGAREELGASGSSEIAGGLQAFLLRGLGLS